MKVLKAIIIIIIVVSLAVVVYAMYEKRVEMNELPADKYTFDVQNDKLALVLDAEIASQSVTVYINDAEQAVQTETVGDSLTILLDINTVAHNETLEIKVIAKDSQGNEEFRAQLKDVCISTDGEVCEHDIKTLVLYDYVGEFPEFDGKRTKSLFVIYSNPSKNTFKLKDVNHLYDLESLWVISNGAVFGDINAVKPLESLERLVIKKGSAIDGNIDDLDGLTLLRTLELNETKIQGDLKDLVPLKKLQSLTLTSNRLLEGDYQWLKKFDDLETLVIEGGRFEGEMPEELVNP